MGDMEHSIVTVAQFILRDLPSRATIGCDWIVVGEVTGILCPWCSRRASIVRKVVGLLPVQHAALFLILALRLGEYS